MRLGIYNGSFDPVHRGHVAIVRHLLKKNYVDKVIVIPTGNYWDKQSLSPVKDRIRMWKYFENERIIVEEEHNELPYTYQLVRALRKKYPGDTFSLILGADTCVRFSDWKNYRELLKLHFLVLPRDGIDIDACMKNLDKTNYTVVPDFEEIDISSSYIRENMDSYEKVRNCVHKRVFEYYRGVLKRMGRVLD